VVHSEGLKCLQPIEGESQIQQAKKALLERGATSQLGVKLAAHTFEGILLRLPIPLGCVVDGLFGLAQTGVSINLFATGE
jgi:hypothetical protein